MEKLIRTVFTIAIIVMVAVVLFVMFFKDRPRMTTQPGPTVDVTMPTMPCGNECGKGA